MPGDSIGGSFRCRRLGRPCHVVEGKPGAGAHGAGTRQVAGSLGVSRESVRRWVMQYEMDAGRAAGVSTDERDELRRLRAENKRLREVNEVLKSATIFFAGELAPRNR